MKTRKLFSILLALSLLLGLFSVPANAERKFGGDTGSESYVYTEADRAALDEDVFAKIREVTTGSAEKIGQTAELNGKADRVVLTEADYVEKIPEVIDAIKRSRTYKKGTLIQNGSVLIWETTVGLPCVYDPYMEAIVNGAEASPDTEGEAAEEVKAAEELLASLEEAKTVTNTKTGTSNLPTSVNVALIQPWWDSNTSYYDENFCKYGNSWVSFWKDLCTTTGSDSDHRYTLKQASVDNVAKAIEECGLVIVNSHGTTDYRDGDDKTSQANCSYICLKTSNGINDNDTKKQTGPYGEYYHVMTASSYTAVSGTCIANHMTKNAPHSFVYWGMCLGMATDGMTASLRKKGVEAVFGFSQSVTFSGDYGYAYSLFSSQEAGAKNLYSAFSLKEAISFAKTQFGNWDPYKGAATELEARAKHAAFPIVVSSEDTYPGHGNVDTLQTVNSTWRLYDAADRDYLLASDISSVGLTATAAPVGKAIGVYAVVNGTKTYLPTDQLGISWQLERDLTVYNMSGWDDQNFVPDETQLDCKIRAIITPKNQDDHPFKFWTKPVTIVTKLDNLQSPIPPEVKQYGTSSSTPYLKVYPGQEYLITASSKEPSESEWKSASSYAYQTEANVTDKMTWGALNYVYTRYMETELYNAGTTIKSSKFWYGDSTGELQATEQDITVAYNASHISHDEGYWIGDVLKIDVRPLPAGASFDGFPGSTWMYPLNNQTEYGSFYADYYCETPLDSDTKYKTVYLKLAKMTSGIAGISCGTTSTKGCYTKIDVADTKGRYDVSKVSVPSYSVQIGTITKDLPITFSPENADYYVSQMTVARNNNVHENGPEGTEPLIAFSKNGTMIVDTTPCIEAPYSFVIYSNGHSVGKMVVWVGSFEMDPITDMYFDQEEVYCYAGRFTSVTLRALPDNATGLLTWNSSDESIVTVNGPAQLNGGSTYAYISVNKEAQSGDQATISATYEEGDVSITASFVVKVQDPPTITKQPSDVKAAEGETVKLSVKAAGDGVSYQWYYCYPDSYIWIPAEEASGKKATYSFTATAERDGCAFKCWVTGGMVVSQEAILTVVYKPKITTQPKTTTVTLGKKASFSVVAGGNDLTYQWYYRTSSKGSWAAVKAAGGKTAKYTLTTEARHNGYQYRCKVKNTQGYVYSSIVTLNVRPKITEQPKSVTVKIGGTAGFTVVAEGKDLTYQWYYRTSSKGDWTEVKAAGGKTANYTMTAAARHHGYQYRCKITSGSTYVYSSIVTLNVKPKITTQPKSVTVTAGKKASFTVVAEGKDLTYQWYYRTSSTGEWTAVKAASGKTANFSLTAQTRHNGYQYRCKVTNSAGTVTSKTVTLTVKN